MEKLCQKGKLHEQPTGPSFGTFINLPTNRTTEDHWAMHKMVEQEEPNLFGPSVARALAVC
jgi:hypothetical protein